MVHIVQEATMSNPQQMEEIEQKLADNTRLTNDKLQAHCSVITTGVIPEISPMKVDTTLQGALGSPENQIEQCNAMEQTNDTDTNDAEDCNADHSYIKRNQDNAKFIAKTLSELKQNTCKLLDVEAMVNLFDNYVSKVANFCGGVPLSFYVTSFSKQDVCQAWLNKYQPTASSPTESAENDSKTKQSQATET